MSRSECSWACSSTLLISVFYPPMGCFQPCSNPRPAVFYQFGFLRVVTIASPSYNQSGPHYRQTGQCKILAFLECYVPVASAGTLPTWQTATTYGVVVPTGTLFVHNWRYPGSAAVDAGVCLHGVALTMMIMLRLALAPSENPCVDPRQSTHLGECVWSASHVC